MKKLVAYFSATGITVAFPVPSLYSSPDSISFRREPPMELILREGTAHG